jgi:hypothetical protein
MPRGVAEAICPGEVTAYASAGVWVVAGFSTPAELRETICRLALWVAAEGEETL